MFVRFENAGQQAPVAAWFHHQPEAGAGRARLLGVAGGGQHRFQCPPSLDEQDLASGGETDMSAAAFQQPDTEPLFELPDCLRQRWLSDHEPRGGAAEVQFLGDSEKVLQLTGLQPIHIPRLSISAGSVLDDRESPVWYRHMTTTTPETNALIIGASRGLGLAMAAEYVTRGWRVTATVRGTSRTWLHDLAESAGGRLTVEENVDVTVPEQLAAAHERVAGTVFDLLFVNAGVTNGDVPVIGVSTETFHHVMVTNALGPMRVVEAFQDVVTPAGTIGVMSSRQGSVALNDNGGNEVYRASKSALNQLMRSFAARHADDPRTLLLISPGWVQTELAGPNAPLTIEESIPGVVDTITKHAGEGGLHFLDYRDQTVPW